MSDSQKTPHRLSETPVDLNSTDPYRVLGVPSTAPQVELKRAYFSLIRQYPPETEGANFKLVRAAYEKVKDIRRRTETDIFLPQAPPPWQAPPFRLRLDTAFHPSDALLALRCWGDLGGVDLEEDFREIEL